MKKMQDFVRVVEKKYKKQSKKEDIEGRFCLVEYNFIAYRIKNIMAHSQI